MNPHWSPTQRPTTQSHMWLGHRGCSQDTNRVPHFHSCLLFLRAGPWPVLGKRVSSSAQCPVPPRTRDTAAAPQPGPSSAAGPGAASAHPLTWVASCVYAGHPVGTVVWLHGGVRSSVAALVSPPDSLHHSMTPLLAPRVWDGSWETSLAPTPQQPPPPTPTSPEPVAQAGSWPYGVWLDFLRVVSRWV